MLIILYITKKYCIKNKISIENAHQFLSFTDYVKNKKSIKVLDNLKLKYSDINYKLLFINTFILSDTPTFDNVIEEYNKLPFKMCDGLVRSLLQKD